MCVLFVLQSKESTDERIAGLRVLDDLDSDISVGSLFAKRKENIPTPVTGET